MSRISRLIVLVTALASLLGVLSATAGAVTWTNDGSTAFTATGGQGTLTSTGVTFSCGGADLSGTAPASSTAATYVVSGTLTFTSCSASGSPVTIECAYSLTATTVVQPLVFGNFDVTCGFYISGTRLCHIEGTTGATYANETGTLSLPTSNSLKMTGASCPVGANDLLHRTSMDFRMTAANPPTITRTP